MLARLACHRLAGLAALALLVALLPLVLPSGFYYRIAALVWVSALAAIGLNVLMGFAGQVSLGHAGFFGIGAYAVAIGPAHLGIPPLPALLGGVVLAGAVAWVVGRPILRLKGLYLAIATLGLGLLVSMVLVNEAGWTGGPDGMQVARPEILSWRPRGGAEWYWITGALMLLGAWLALNLHAGPAGRALRATHDSEVAAALAGIDVAAAKLRAFVIAAVYAALAGALQAMMNGFVTPDTAGFLHSIELVTMVVLGGLGSVLGSVAGAALLVVLPQALTFLQHYEQAVLGAIIILAMIFLRDGIVPSLRQRLRRASP